MTTAPTNFLFEGTTLRPYHFILQAGDINDVLEPLGSRRLYTNEIDFPKFDYKYLTCSKILLTRKIASTDPIFLKNDVAQITFYDGFPEIFIPRDTVVTGKTPSFFFEINNLFKKLPDDTIENVESVMLEPLNSFFSYPVQTPSRFWRFDITNIKDDTVHEQLRYYILTFLCTAYYNE